MRPLFDAILKTIPPPKGDLAGPLQILVANLDYSDYLGRLAIARVFNGKMFTGEEVAIAKLDHSLHKTKITKLFSFSGLKRTDITETELGDIVAVAGVEGITIGETITDVENPAPLPHIAIDEPTIAMLFTVNTSPFAGKDGTLRYRPAICASASRKNCSPTSRCASKTLAPPTPSKCSAAANCSSPS